MDPGIPLIGNYPNFVAGDCVAVVLVLYALIKKHKSLLLLNFKYLVIAIVLYHMITCVFQELSHMAFYLMIIFRGLAVCYVFDFYIKKIYNNNFLILSLFLISFTLLYMSILEAISNSNPFMEWFESVSGIECNYLNDFRYGLNRVQCFSRHATTCSFVGLFIMAISSLLLKGTYSKANRFVLLSALFASLVVTFLTGTRSAMIPAVLILSALIKVSKFLQSFGFLFIISVCLYFVIPEDYINEIISSFTDTEIEGGSNVSMRGEQFLISFSLMMNSLLWGNGANTFSLYSTILGGAESCWFQLMIDFGLISCLVILLVYYKAIRISIQRRNYDLVRIVIAFIFINSFTSLPGYNLEFYTYGSLFLMLIIEQKLSIEKCYYR